MKDETTQKVISVTIKDRNALRAAYMPFLTKGGLFIPTSKRYQLGDRVQLLMDLMDEPEILKVLGEVVWITPKGAHGAMGIGVVFMGEFEVVRAKIESFLVGLLDQANPTHTL